jgi:hypothetical protein
MLSPQLLELLRAWCREAAAMTSSSEVRDAPLRKRAAHDHDLQTQSHGEPPQRILEVSVAERHHRQPAPRPGGDFRWYVGIDEIGRDGAAVPRAMFK